MLTIMQSFGLSLQGHARREGLDASTAATRTLRAVQRNHDVTQLCSAEGTAVDQLILMDDASSNTYVHRVKIVTSDRQRN